MHTSTAKAQWTKFRRGGFGEAGSARRVRRGGFGEAGSARRVRRGGFGEAGSARRVRLVRRLSSALSPCGDFHEAASRQIVGSRAADGVFRSTICDPSIRDTKRFTLSWIIRVKEKGSPSDNEFMEGRYSAFPRRWEESNGGARRGRERGHGRGPSRR